MLEGLRTSWSATGIADVMWFRTNEERQNNKKRIKRLGIKRIDFLRHDLKRIGHLLVRER